MSLFKEKLAIRELLDRYCDGVNQRDASIWGDTWSENAIWEIPHLNLKNEGKEAIINVWNEAMKGYPFVHMIAQPGFIEIDGNKAIVDGVKQLQGASVKATDLRASMSLIAASLNANGESVVNDLSHLKRGYENFEEKLFNIGANIR